ncbi:MAG: hypothetical protein NTV80_10380, partial [Verrucomicrobia bacterium]|nr:hypothetical protein [Verrucomicrobiota bacterium]
MPARPSSSKSAETHSVSPADDELEASAPAKKPAKKVLSLIEEEKPKVRGARKEGNALPVLGARPAPQVVKEEPPAEPAKPSVDDAKKAALNLFEEDEKPKVKRRPAGANTISALAPISRLKESGPVEVIEVPVIQPVVKVEEAPVEFELNEAGEKIIHLKPP